MKTNKILIGATAIAISALLTVTGCRKKSNEETPDSETATVTDNNLAEAHSKDITTMGSEAKENGALSSYRIDGNSYVGSITSAPCATVTIDTTVKTFTVNFGTTPCNCLDGRKRSGMLIYNYSASTNNARFPRQPGFSVSVTSNNYVVDSYTINIINRTHTNTTPIGFNPSSTNITWSTSSNLQIKKPDGTTITWNCNRTSELLNTNDPTIYNPTGNFPINWLHGKFKFNGTASGVNAKSENYTVTMSNLILDMNCAPDPLRPHRHPFIQGTLSYTPGTRPTRTVDFGNGSCDFNATVTINGVTYSITLP